MLSASFKTAAIIIGQLFLSFSRTKEIAEKSKERLANSGRFTEPIVTTIEPAAPFYPAEEYHQDFYKKTLCVMDCPINVEVNLLKKME